MADPNAVQLQPFVEFIQPYVTIVLSTVVTALVGIAVAKLTSWLGVSMDAAQVARLKSAAATEAGVLVAQAADDLRGKSINVGDPRVVAAAASIAAKLPDTAASVGATPEALQKMVAGEIGKLQSGVPASPTAH